MDRIYASLERIKALWLQLEHATPHTPEHDALMKKIRDESDAYRALIDEEKSPHPNREDSN